MTRGTLNISRVMVLERASRVRGLFYVNFTFLGSPVKNSHKVTKEVYFESVAVRALQNARFNESVVNNHAMRLQTKAPLLLK